MDQSLCACSCTHVASLQRSTLHISNWKIVFVFVGFFKFCLFVLFYFLVALRKMGEKECYNSDWVRSGFERGERGSESVTSCLSAIDPRQCWNLQGWWTISATVPETRAPFNLSLSAASSTSEITCCPLLFTHRHCSCDTSETDFVFPFQYLTRRKIQMLKDAQSFLLNHSHTVFFNTHLVFITPNKQCDACSGVVGIHQRTLPPAALLFVDWLFIAHSSQWKAESIFPICESLMTSATNPLKFHISFHVWTLSQVTDLEWWWWLAR